MNKPVSFKLAKLLKDKGFTFKQNETYYNPVNEFAKYEDIVLTIVDVVMWLYEKHGIWISVDIETNEPHKNTFYYIVKNTINKNSYSESLYKSPTKAYLKAIEYTLKNLI